MRTVNPQIVENRRRQIIEAARFCFDQKGFHGTSMAEICARAEISPGGLYRYFSSKEEIITAISEDSNSNLIAILEDKITEIENGAHFCNSVNDIINELVLNYFTRDLSALAAESLAESMRNPTFAKTAAKSYKDFNTLLIKLLEIGKSKGVVATQTNSEEAAAIMMASIDGLLLRLAYMNDFSTETAFNWLSNLFRLYIGESIITNAKLNFNNNL